MLNIKSLLFIVCLNLVLVPWAGAQSTGARMGKSPDHKKRMGKSPDSKKGGSNEPRDIALNAQSYLDQAQSSSDPEKRAALQLQAAKEYIKGKYYEQADSILAGLDASRLSESLQYPYKLLAAEIAMSKQDPNKALSLATKPPRSAPQPLQLQAHKTRAAAFLQLGNRLQSFQELLIAAQLAPADEQDKINKAIWQTLQQIPNEGLKSLTGQSDSKQMAGWVALVLVYKKSKLSPDALKANIESWRNKYSDHPAQKQIIGTLTKELESIQSRPEKLALLVPLDGRISRSSKAIRDGFIAAHFATTNDRKKIELRIYNTSGKDVTKVYDEAVQNGAQLVIGPLKRKNVKKLSQHGSVSTPILALNILARDEGTAPENMYFFGLSYRDEAKQVAEKAIFDNRTNAIAIVPHSRWGGKVLKAFLSRYQQLGGKLLKYTTYKKSQTDFGRQLKHLLNLDESKTRHNNLRSVIDTKMHFVTRRRSDAEFIFVVASPRTARLIAPQLRYYHAKDLPIYSTSHVYGGTENTRQNVDINGLLFCDIPLVLGDQKQTGSIKAEIVKQWPNKISNSIRLYAIGIDAYNLIPYLKWLKDRPYERFAGYTGKLSIDKNNNVHRTLQWAKIIKGKATVIQERLGTPLENQVKN